MRTSNPERWRRLEGLILAAPTAFALAVYLLLKGVIWGHGLDSMGAGFVIGILAPATLFGVFVLLSLLWSIGLARTETTPGGLLKLVSGIVLGGVLMVPLFFVVRNFVVVLQSQLDRRPLPSGQTHLPLPEGWRNAAWLSGVLFWVFLALLGALFVYHRKTRPAAAAGPPAAGHAPAGDVGAYARACVAGPAIALMFAGLLDIVLLVGNMVFLLALTNSGPQVAVSRPESAGA